ncbi:MAG: hypothetical protein ACKOC5_19185 [Chloroflexota bacterium]
MEDKITIIEGPPPTFEAVADGWVMGLTESPNPYNIAVTRLRTFNGAALTERCHRAWRLGSSMNLEYRSSDGLKSYAPIVAARTLDVDEGQMLVLWVKLEADESEFVVDDDDYDDDFDDDDDADGDIDDLDNDLKL